MCLAIPGKVVSIESTGDAGIRMGRISFGGIIKNVCLEYIPETQVGDYVLVHVGFALSRIDEEEAERTFKLLEEMEQLAELQVDSPSSGEEGGES